MKLIQNKNKTFLIQFLFILLINFFLTIQNEIQFQFQTSLFASDGEEYDKFGYSVSISNDGNFALIGAYGATDYQGKVYIFQKNGNEWNQSQILIANDGKAYDEFGYSVSISNDGNFALIGAYQATVGNNYYQGKAYIFQKNGNEWNQSQILIASDGKADDEFGYSVSISNDGNIALIGAYQATVGNNYQQGKAYIFQKNGNEWNQSQILIANDGEAYDEFGYSVSISNDGNIALIGAPQANDVHGKAYIFQKNGNEWNQSQILIGSDGEEYDNFGYSVSISNDGNIALIGAPYATVGNNSYEQGKAYIFQKNENQTIWNQSQILIANDGEADDWFGSSVSISNDGNIALIGAPDANKAYIFQKNGNEWNQIQILIANDGEENDGFGISVSISNDYAIIGASGHDLQQGEGYLFVKTIIPSSSSSNSKTIIIVCSTVIPIIVIIGIILTIFFIRKKRKKEPEIILKESEMKKWILKEDK